MSNCVTRTSQKPGSSLALTESLSARLISLPKLQSDSDLTPLWFFIIVFSTGFFSFAFILYLQTKLVSHLHLTETKGQQFSSRDQILSLLIPATPGKPQIKIQVVPITTVKVY